MESRQITCSIPFLSRDKLYETEKPYGLHFTVDHIEGARMTNHIFDIQQVLVEDARYLLRPLTMEANGACFIRAKTSLRAGEEATNQTPAMRQYIDEILRILRNSFPEYREIRLLDYRIRKRSTGFPKAHGQAVQYSQPAAFPHTDFSIAGAYMRLGELFPSEKDSLSSRDFDLINVWRVISGPNDDWPLAVCDYTTIDWANDTTPNDSVYLHGVAENCLLHANPAQKWYYLSAMDEEDLIVFRNTDSKGQRSKCFHAAVDNPKSRSPPRESIEVRMVAFRD